MIPGLENVLPGLTAASGGGGSRTSFTSSQSQNIAFNPSIVNILGGGSASSTPSGSASGSPSASASLPDYLPSGAGYGSNYPARPYGSIDAYQAPRAAAPVASASLFDDPMLLLLGLGAVAVFMFAGK